MGVRDPQKRKAKFSVQELSVEEVQEKKDELLLAFKDLGASWKKKEKWEEVAMKVSAVGVSDRTGNECRKKWTKYRRKGKGNANEVQQHIKKTGGGPQTSTNLNETEELAAAVIGKTAIEGVEGGIDTAASQSPQPAHSPEGPEPPNLINLVHRMTVLARGRGGILANEKTTDTSS